MKSVVQSVLFSMFLLSASSQILAIDLATAYSKATLYDSELAAALAGRNANAEGVNLARSGLLPTVALGASSTYSDFDRDSGASDGYSSTGASVSVSQPLLKLDTYHDFKASEFSQLQADAQYLEAQQGLIFRTADAYFGVLRAWDTLTTTKRAEEAFKRQWEQAKERFEVGLIAITEVHETKAIYDSGKVSRINAQQQLDVSLEVLERITGQFTDRVLTLSPNFPLSLEDDKSLDEWEKIAYANNPQMLAAKWNVRSAESAVKAREAGHYPTINAEASYGYSDFDGPSPADDQSRDSSIGITLSMPLYAGGGVTAGVRQAKHLLDQAEQALTTTQRNIRVQLRSLYRTLRTDVEAIQARKQETVSNESALEATRAGYDVGTRNIVEVLDAERQYFVSLNNYSNAIYDYIINQLSFRQVAGVLTEQDLTNLNTWLKAPVNVGAL